MRVTARCLYSVLMRGPLCVVPPPSEPDAAVVPLVVAFHFVAIPHTGSHADTVFFCLGYKALLVDDWPDCLDPVCFQCACSSASLLGNLSPAVLLSQSHSRLESKVQQAFQQRNDFASNSGKLYYMYLHFSLSCCYLCSAQSNNIPLNARRVFMLNCDD